VALLLDNKGLVMNIKQLENEIVKALEINEKVDWAFSDISIKQEFKELKIFIKKLFKEYRQD
jgi:hypothetical protein